jgi:hypothetical protein
MGCWGVAAGEGSGGGGRSVAGNGFAAKERRAGEAARSLASTSPGFTPECKEGSAMFSPPMEPAVWGGNKHCIGVPVILF